MSDNQANYIFNSTCNPNTPTRFRTLFFLNEILNEFENEEIEYKNYTFPVGIEQERIIKKAINGFLNNKGGRIYFGVNDNRRVVGTELSDSMKDKVGNFIINTTKFFVPSCRHSHVSVKYLPVIKPYFKETQSNLYIIKVIVKQGDISKLYSVSDYVYESYFRAGAQTIQLRADDISKEINKRSRGKTLIIKMNSQDFLDDPQELGSPIMSPVYSPIIYSPPSKSSFLFEQNAGIEAERRSLSPISNVDKKYQQQSYLSTSPTKSFSSDQEGGGIFPSKTQDQQPQLLSRKRKNSKENGLTSNIQELEEPIAIPLYSKDIRISRVARKIARDIINLDEE